MHRTRQVFSVVFIVLGAALLARGLWAGAWPLSLQTILGVLLLAMGVLRLRYS